MSREPLRSMTVRREAADRYSAADAPAALEGAERAFPGYALQLEQEGDQFLVRSRLPVARWLRT